MILVGIDVGKNQHTFSIVDKDTGEILLKPSGFDNNQKGFMVLIEKLKRHSKPELLIGMEKLNGLDATYFQDQSFFAYLQRSKICKTPLNVILFF